MFVAIPCNAAPAGPAVRISKEQAKTLYQQSGKDSIRTDFKETTTDYLWSKLHTQMFSQTGTVVLIKNEKVLKLVPDDGFTAEPHTETPVLIIFKTDSHEKPALVYIARTHGSGRPIVNSTLFVIHEVDGNLKQEQIISQIDDMKLTEENDHSVRISGGGFGGFAGGKLIFNGTKFLIN
jgi:hypothetical protein